MDEPNEDDDQPFWRVPLDPSVPFEDVEAALLASEMAIPQAMVDAYQNRSAITHADFYAMGIARRATALSSGFRVSAMTVSRIGKRVRTWDNLSA